MQNEVANFTQKTQLFAFGDCLVRTIQIQNEVWFVGKDIAQILGYTAPQNAIAKHVDKKNKTTAPIQCTGSNYKSQTLLINEAGLYSLILASKLPSAKEFKNWVVSEVLPTIRKTGGYGTLDTELEQEKKKLEIAQLRAQRYILENLAALGEKKLLTRSAIQKIVGNAAGETSSAAFSDEDARVKNFIFETCRVVEIGFIPIKELYARYEKWAVANYLSQNTFVRRVQKVMGKFVDYKQKRVNGEPVWVFTGIEFLE